jgi:hypothetical protein
MPDELTATHDDDQRLGRCEMELRDGTILDLTGKTVGDAIALIRARGITALDIRETRHFVDRW